MHIMVHGEDAAGTKEAADFLRKLIKEQVPGNIISGTNSNLFLG